MLAGSRCIRPACSKYTRGGGGCTRSQNVQLKNLSFLAKSKIGIFACFFRANLTVLGVLMGSGGQ
jgi:hypothetical protein